MGSSAAWARGEWRIATDSCRPRSGDVTQKLQKWGDILKGDVGVGFVGFADQGRCARERSHTALFEADVAEQGVAYAAPHCQAECHAPVADLEAWPCMPCEGEVADRPSPSHQVGCRGHARFAQRLRRDYGEGVDGGAGPKDMIRRAGSGMAAAVTGQERPRGTRSLARRRGRLLGIRRVAEER